MAVANGPFVHNVRSLLDVGYKNSHGCVAFTCVQSVRISISYCKFIAVGGFLILVVVRI